MRTIKIAFTFLVALVLMSSCRSSKKEVLYLQDAVYNQQMAINNVKTIKVQPGDELQINVSCRDKQLAEMFNLRNGSQGTSSSNMQRLGYLVGQDGDIELPVLGKVNVAGLDRSEVASKISDELISRNLLKDPVVTVSFLNLHFSVLGEVGSPGQYAIDRDKVNLFEAISLAGDLTINGERDKVYVVREENGNRVMHRVDLKSTDVFESPVFYLQQNDLVIVEPNGMRAGQRKANENSLKSISMWMSIVTFLTTMTLLFVK